MMDLPEQLMCILKNGFTEHEKHVKNRRNVYIALRIPKEYDEKRTLVFGENLLAEETLIVLGKVGGTLPEFNVYDVAHLNERLKKKIFHDKEWTVASATIDELIPIVSENMSRDTPSGYASLGDVELADWNFYHFVWSEKYFRCDTTTLFNLKLEMMRQMTNVQAE